MEIVATEKCLLLELLAQLAPESSQNTLRLWIEQGRVMIEERIASRPKQFIEKGQKLSVRAKCTFLAKGLKIVYEDADLVVVDKPEGLLSVATDMGTEPTVHGILKRKNPKRRVFPIHRLDKETSGLLVFAFTSKACAGLKGQLAMRTMHREYRALVHGTFDKTAKKGTWSSYLYEDKSMQVHITTEEEGKIAVTHYEQLKKEGPFWLLKLNLETGRKHQIRVQAAHAGHPVVGDKRYGYPQDKKRLCLHATALSFQHPLLEKPMHFFSPHSF